jgi:hypothetical protein
MRKVGAKGEHLGRLIVAGVKGKRNSFRRKNGIDSDLADFDPELADDRLYARGGVPSDLQELGVTVLS